MHETDAFRQQCRTEVIARWWVPLTQYNADYRRDGVLTIYSREVPLAYCRCGFCCAADWARKNGYVRLGEQP